MSDYFQFKDRRLLLKQTHVMGILNVTPDSFSDGGRYRQLDQALNQAERMVDEGAVILDVGGESTRPGAQPVSVAEELDRVIPVVEQLSRNVDVIVSVDTSTPAVMLESAKAGAQLINDVRALQRAGAIEAAVETALPVCLMHMQGSPDNMQDAPKYQQVVSDVQRFLRERIRVCHDAGIEQSKIILDPGFGFGKTLEHNLALVDQLDQIAIDGCPVLAGMSRKSMIGAVLNKEVEHRLNGSLALAAAAVLKGAFIVRVHDVPETVDVVRMLNAVRAGQI